MHFILNLSIGTDSLVRTESPARCKDKTSAHFHTCSRLRRHPFTPCCALTCRRRLCTGYTFNPSFNACVFPSLIQPPWHPTLTYPYTSTSPLCCPSSLISIHQIESFISIWGDGKFKPQSALTASLSASALSLFSHFLNISPFCSFTAILNILPLSFNTAKPLPSAHCPQYVNRPWRLQSCHTHC